MTGYQASVQSVSLTAVLFPDESLLSESANIVML